MTHDEQMNLLSVFTDDKSDAGSYPVTLRSVMTVPNDHTLTTFSEIVAEVQIEIIVNDLCLDTEFSQFVVEDMTTDQQDTTI